MSNAKSKQAKPKTGLARCMELASDRKGLVFLAAVLSSLTPRNIGTYAIFPCHLLSQASAATLWQATKSSDATLA